MYPALSVIVFTTVSGIGLGLLFWSALWQVLGPLPLSRELALAPVLLGALLLVIGLLSAAAHLGRPQRAWRAFSQWRTSWLSREAVAASLTLLATGVAAASIWCAPGSLGTAATAAVLAVLAGLTVYTTAGIYFSLRPIPAWSNHFVAPAFLLAAALSGAALLWSLLSLAGWVPGQATSIGFGVGALAYAVLKLVYWRHIDRYGARIGTGAVTGLGGRGHVSPADAPHRQANYLLREMGYALARRHSRRLRFFVVALCGLVPILCAVWSAIRSESIGPSIVAFTALTAGLLAERWLFFAEARHVVVAYYR